MRIKEGFLCKFDKTAVTLLFSDSILFKVSSRVVAFLRPAQFANSLADGVAYAISQFGKDRPSTSLSYKIRILE